MYSLIYYQGGSSHLVEIDPQELKGSKGTPDSTLADHAATIVAEPDAAFSVRDSQGIVLFTEEDLI